LVVYLLKDTLRNQGHLLFVQWYRSKAKTQQAGRIYLTNFSTSMTLITVVPSLSSLQNIVQELFQTAHGKLEGKTQNR